MMILMSAIIFYINLISDLRKLVFVLIPYETCIENNTVKGEFTIIWNVDLKM